ncbi:MAG: serine hydrolase [Cytophagales bacterium]|nr:serine hydrolase [Cytophagales bacterium]
MKIFICSILIFFCAHLSFGQDFNKVRLDSLLELIETKQKGMGSISIFKDGGEVYHKSIGYADVEEHLKADRDTRYRIGSISKPFTAALILQMVEEEKLTLETRLSEFFPEIPNSQKISIEHLLRHRSGLYNFTNAGDYPKWMESPQTKSQLIDLFIKNGVVFQPDEKFEYSNTNYVLLSYILEETEEKTLAEILMERICKPLNLEHTYLGGKIMTGRNEAQSYFFNDGWKLGPETDMSIPSGAGAVVSTPADLNTFFTALFFGKLLNKSSLEQMKELVDGYGLGLFQMPFYSRKAFGHNGGIDGFQSNASFFESDKVAVALTMNAVEMGVNDILIGVLSIYFGREYDFPAFQPGIQVTSGELDKYLGIYSSEDLPLKITISKKGNRLFAQATGQSEFPLEPYETDKFRFERAGIKMEFLPEERKMVLIQGARYEYILDE